MQKFTQIDLNEELLNLFKQKTDKIETVKVSRKLLDLYSKNLISDEFLTLHPQEKDNYDFEFYKINLIQRTNGDEYLVEIETFDRSHNKLGKIKYRLTF